MGPNKFLFFEYIVKKLLEWHFSCTGRARDLSSFTKLKLQKLLFFVAAINSTNENHSLLDIFNRFYALQYGPVELDIYEKMGQNSFVNIQFNGRNLININTDNIIIEDPIKTSIDTAIDSLKDKNFKLISAPAFVLVDISHKWPVWQEAMYVADVLGVSKMKISTEEICSSDKFYTD